MFATPLHVRRSGIEALAKQGGNVMVRKGAGTAVTVGAVVALVVLLGLWSHVGVWPSARRAAAQDDPVGEPLPGDARPVGGEAVQGVAPGAFDDQRSELVGGIRPFQASAAEIDARVEALANAYERAAGGASDKPARGRNSDPPDDPNAPPRMDSGDPDPDRAHFDPTVRAVTMGVAR